MKLSLLLNFIALAMGANILVMIPLSPKSHANTFIPLFKNLVSRGHKVTFVSPFPIADAPLNWTNIPIKNYFNEFVTKQTESGTSVFGQFNKYTLLPRIWSMYLDIQKQLFNDGILQGLLDQDIKYDLVIAEAHYIQEFVIIFGHIYNVPVINIEFHYPSSWSCYLTGGICPYSFVPNYKTRYSDRMSLLERFDNTLISILEVLGGYYYSVPQQEALVKEYFHHPKIKNIPPLIDLLKNTSFTLMDTHYSFAYPRPYHPNVAEVGGITIGTGDIIGQDLKDFLDQSENGVIYFSFGSILPMSALPKNVLDSFLMAFKSLKQNVLMKWETGSLETPNNVKTISWAPQQNILAHPKCILFISHGGIHSLLEATYHGVPLLIIPFYSDQHFNGKYASSNGFAYVIPNNDITSKTILHGIETVLNEPMYKKNVLKQSSLLRDRPMSAMDTAVYWTEYILKHGGNHLRPKSLDLNIFTYLLVDIILVAISVFLSVIIFIYTIFRFITNNKIVKTKETKRLTKKKL